MDRREGTVLMGTLLTPRFAPTAEPATHSLPRGCGPKLLLTACQEGAVQNCYSQPTAYKPSYVTLIGCKMPFCSIPIHLLPDKRHPRAAEISIILHQHYFKIWGVLGVLVSYEITRGIKLDVRRVTERVNGVFWGV